MTDGKSAPQNIQDAFLNTVRREKVAVTIYLLSGAKLLGKIRSFDKFSVLLESNSQEQLIFKHAISTITVVRRASGELRGQPAEVPHTEAQPQSDGSSKS
jgi:host factor-I protein